MAHTILVVDDEEDILDVVAYNLRQSGYSVVTAHNGEAALAQFAPGRELPDLVILDVMLPDVSGVEVCRRLRQTEHTRRVPIVMLTARGQEVDRVIGFELGADDYVVKPFSPRELILRVGAVLRRHGIANPDERQEVQVGRLTLDVPRHTVRVDGQGVELTALEFKLLLDLANRRGRVQSREALLNRVWGYGPGVETRTVDTHVKRLREKLGSVGDYLETVRGVGYRFRDDIA